MNIASIWKRVHNVWLQSKIAIPDGVTQVEIASFEGKYGVVLTSDLRDYFLAADGTGDDMDDGAYRFWPLAEVQPVHDFLDSDSYPDRFAHPNCFVFADYCINCWMYAVRITDDAMQPAPVFRVTGSDHPVVQMAPSFRDFMARYAADPNSIM